MGVFPKWQEGRHPHCHFRGLLKLHSRYGPSDRSAAQRRPLSRGSSPASYPAKPLASFRTQSIIVQVEPSSTDDPRRKGALPTTDVSRWSGRIVARFAVGEGFPVPLFRLRGGVTVSPWRTFPRSPLRFRTASFPCYGSKAGLSDRAFPDHTSVKLAPSMPV